MRAVCLPLTIIKFYYEFFLFVRSFVRSPQSMAFLRWIFFFSTLNFAKKYLKPAKKSFFWMFFFGLLFCTFQLFFWPHRCTALRKATIQTWLAVFLSLFKCDQERIKNEREKRKCAQIRSSTEFNQIKVNLSILTYHSMMMDGRRKIMYLIHKDRMSFWSYRR